MTLATGEQWTRERLLEAAARTIDFERVINARFGLDCRDDRLPERFMNETVEDGLPTAATLGRLGLAWAAAASAPVRRRGSAS